MSAREKGFTLIEVLLAVAILGMVFTGIYAFYFSGVHTWQKGLDRMDYQQTARISAEKIVTDLRFAAFAAVQQGGQELRFKTKGDFGFHSENSFRRFRQAGDELVLEEVRNGSIYSHAKVAQNITEIFFSMNNNKNIEITVLVGSGPEQTAVQTSVMPRNMPGEK